MKNANLGTVSHGTLRTEDLLSRFVSELEWQIRRNGEHFARPENFAERDRLANLIGEAQDCFADDGETIDPEKEETAADIVNELTDALSTFAPSYCYFGAHPGDGSDFGFWVGEIEDVKEQVGFSSVKSLSDARSLGIETDPEDSEYPPQAFRGEWLHVNERGNCTLYVREDSANGFTDREVWAIV